MTELLVVIGIIAVLAGILLVAMRGVRVRAKYTQTESTMQSFAAACDSFQMEHGRYPGVVPETAFAGAAAIGPTAISGTENALLDLMGGVIRGDDPRWNDAEFNTSDWELIEIDGSTPLGKIKVNRQLIGEGPVLNGQPYAPYFTPSEANLGVVKGQVDEDGFLQCCRSFDPRCNECLPDLLDAWGQPIIYLRRSRARGPLTMDGSGVPPQFLLRSMMPYTTSKGLGEFNKNQNPAAIYQDYSVLNAPGNDLNTTFAQTIRHPAFGAPDGPLTGTARGAYVLISAGPDGIFFSRTDGPGTPTAPEDDIVGDHHPKVVDEYDDIRRLGGG